MIRRAGFGAFAAKGALVATLSVSLGVVTSLVGGPTSLADEGTDAALEEASSPAPSATSAVPGAHLKGDSRWRCPRDMVLVEGASCPTLAQTCLEWLPPLRGSPPRCARFEPFTPSPSCPASDTAKGPGNPQRPLRFCIDRFEFPNRAGALPVIQRTWEDAQAQCHRRGRRLCKSAEWTLACEGEERLGYPYGDLRDPEACNIDQPLELRQERPTGRRHPRHRVRQRPTPVDHRVRSGAFGRCVSPYGVHDMTGNVDEWVVNESGWPHASGLKGGFWGPVRASCRPMTTAHDVTFAYYQIGFRCCDEPTKPPAR